MDKTKTSAKIVVKQDVETREPIAYLGKMTGNIYYKANFGSYFLSPEGFGEKMAVAIPDEFNDIRSYEPIYDDVTVTITIKRT